MRVGQNPIKVVRPILQKPEDVTIVVANFIPYLNGYYKRGLEILKLCINSIHKNTELPFDLLVFDNASCPEVRAYLLDQAEQNRIQMLMLSDKNVGIPGAWNAALRAAPGKYIAYSDNDVYYYPGWLPEHLKVFDAYPNVGMVTGIPLRSPEIYSSNSLAWAEKTSGVEITQGALLEWEIAWAHSRSLGMTESEAREIYQNGNDVMLNYRGVRTYLGAGHFQYVVRREILEKILPLPIEIAMGNERLFDSRINDAKLLRLSLTKMFVHHIGNQPPPGFLNQEMESNAIPSKKREIDVNGFYRFLELWPIKKILLFIHGKIFDLYYNRK